MARFGQGFIQSITNPGYSQGMFNLGATLGSAPAANAGFRAEEQKKQEQSKAMQIVNQALASNDPQQLLQAAKQMANIDPNLSMKLAQAAQQATAGQQKLTQEQEQARAGRGVQGGLAAISQAAARGIPLEQLNEGIRSVIDQGGTQADIMEAYNKGKGQTDKPTYQNVSPGGVVLQDGKVIYQAPFKPTPPPTPAKPTFSYQRIGDKGNEQLVVLQDGVEVNRISPQQNESNSDFTKRAGEITIYSGALNTIKDAKDLIANSSLSTGAPGQVSTMLGVGAGANLDSYFTTIKSVEALSAIKQLKAASKTGSTGLGAVSNIELSRLESQLVNLRVGNYDEKSLRDLEQLERQYQKMLQIASGVIPEEAINWNAPEYQVAGYSEIQGNVFYAPNGDEGTVYKLTDGEFLPIQRPGQ